MPDITTFEKIKGLSLSAFEIKTLTNWPDPIIDEFLNMIQGLVKIAELIDIEIDQKLEEIRTDFLDGSIPYVDTNLLVEDNTNLKWDTVLKLLTAFSIYTNQIDFNLAPTITPAEGRLSWNPTDGTLDLGMGLNGIVTQQIGQELFVKAVNKTGSTITEGSVVYCDGRQGIRPKIALAQSDVEATSMVLGVVTQDIPDNEEGYVTTFGYVRKIKTDYATWTEGDTLWVSKTTAGVLTNVEPAAPHHSDLVGSVGIVHANQGSIFVCINRHRTLEELSDVNGTPLAATGQFPVWDNVNKYFDFNYNITDYSEAENGTAQGQLAFWDATAGKWVHTETSEIVWDDVNKREGINAATPTERLEIGGNLFLNADSDKVLLGAGKDLSIYYNGTDGYIKTNEVAASDLHITTGAAKTVVYDTTIWEDLNFSPDRSGGPVETRPVDVTINNVIHKEFTNSNNQLCGATQEIPHNYKLNTNLHPHCHIFLKSGESAGTTGVTFKFYWELRETTGTTSGSTTLSATSAQLGTTAGANKLDIYSGSFAGSAELGAQLAVTIARTAGDAGDIIVTTYGVHYEKDTPGSRTETTK